LRPRRANLVPRRQVLIHPDLQDGGWIAEVPNLPGCISDGETREKPIRNVREAINAWIEVAREDADPTPTEHLGAQLVVLDAV